MEEVCRGSAYLQKQREYVEEVHFHRKYVEEVCRGSAYLQKQREYVEEVHFHRKYVEEVLITGSRDSMANVCIYRKCSR